MFWTTDPRPAARSGLPCVFTGALAASVGLSHAAGLVDTVEVVQAREEAASRQVAADRVAVLVESHDCWTGPSPHGDEVIPGHAVVTLPGGAPRLPGAHHQG